MFGNRFALVTIILLISICNALFVSTAQAQHNPYDDDTVLEFYWEAASGNVDHYNVYLYVDGSKYQEEWTTTTAPTLEEPYVVPIVAEDGETYQFQVQAEDANGTTGPMSEMSDSVLCKLRSPGDINDSTVADANGDLRVSAGDWAILCSAWDTQRGDNSFDYRADFNYDGSVDVSDLAVVISNWGNSYSGQAGAPTLFPPAASSNEIKRS